MELRGLAALPESEETKTSCPPPRSIIGGNSAWASSIGASRLTRSARFTSSGVNSASHPAAGRPALATRMSTSPASAASRSAAPGSARSATKTRWPSPGSANASASSTSDLRALRATPAPHAASAFAIARPRPPVAPVRSAVRPASSIPRRKLAASRPTGIRVPSAKGDKCLFSVSKRPVDRLDCRRSEQPKRRIPSAWRRHGSGGTTFSGLTHLIEAGAQAPFAPARQLTP